ncbi:hypothetical protein KW790_03365, partial [Candidatus Parcubacteria bacterium]|nr:hypothetical protein [Candidatus Parcubacteria bacterium]
MTYIQSHWFTSVPKKIRLGVVVYLVLSVLAINLPLQAFAQQADLSVNLTANGQDSLTLATSTDSFTINLASENAVSCNQTDPISSAVIPTWNTTINPGDPWYPAEGGSTTITVNCSDASGNTLSDSVVISLPVTGTGSNGAAPIDPSSPSTGTDDVISIDVKANASDGPVVINQGDTYTYSWVSNGATSCLQTSPVNSGISLVGQSASITPGHPFYPTASSSTTITVTCNNGVASATDSVVISLA